MLQQVSRGLCGVAICCQPILRCRIAVLDYVMLCALVFDVNSDLVASNHTKTKLEAGRVMVLTTTNTAGDCVWRSHRALQWGFTAVF